VSSFSYFNPGINYLNKPKKTEGGTFYELEHVDQNIVPEQHNVHCLGLEGTGNNSNQWKCVYSIGVQTTSVTIGGTLLCSPSSGNFNIGISSLCDIPASPGTNQNLIWTGSAFAWCDTTSGYSSAAFDTDFGNKSTTDLSEGTNCYYTDVRAQTAITGGTGVTVVSGAVSIPQTVATTSCPTFCNLTIDGNLTVNGACTIVTSNCVNIGDSTITLNSDELGTPTENAGLEVERGTATNVGIIWNETSDVWQVTCDGSTYNNIISTPDVTSSLPSQTGNSGCYLGTDGASASWDTLTKTTVGLSNVDNTTDAGKPISTSTQSALNLKAPLASPAFTGTPTGITKTHVGLSDVDNTTDAGKPISTSTQSALNLKAPLASPAFTGTPTGITKTHVGLSDVDNTTDAGKPISTATQTALDDKLAITTAGTTYAPLASPALTGTATGVNLTLSGDLTVDGTTTTLNSTTVQIDDKNIELGTVATPTDVTADGGGITLKGTTDKTIVWDDTNDNWTSNQDWNLPTGKVFKINNISVLSATTLQYLDATSSVQTQIDAKLATTTASSTYAPLYYPSIVGPWSWTGTASADDITVRTIANLSTSTTDVTVGATFSMMIAGPFTAPNVTANGNLNVLTELNVTGDINIGASGSIHIIG
jgi:hypothetical protein